MTDNEEGTPFFTKYTHLVPTAKSPAPESKEDELSSSDEAVNKEIDTKEFILEFANRRGREGFCPIAEVTGFYIFGNVMTHSTPPIAS